ncbi:hypothetical protein L208DRAFT_782656 [Tricholoma matsutake]|nr:hypothetical protein L208DRAFT_782656 [Tricholoma matsutake 945]
MHRTTMIGTRIWGCVGHGTGQRVVGDMKLFFSSFFFISLSSPACSQRDAMWPQFFSRHVFNSASLVFRRVKFNTYCFFVHDGW